ncbi:potassium channel protein [uncultured Neptuniibacter sp.]|uniref:potassium channel protein n=1 Tax=uncultured Neptuniibacter sp. TaxID=502143 RepID=UPI0026169980|nr:potassium channel protein [uncultured Neptuniibacter sp.]
MLVFKSLRKLIYRHFKNMRWQAVLALVLLYGSSSWLFLYLAKEQNITGQDFIYWLIVTASTVGYGDLSPETPVGKMIAAFYIIPFGLGIFALTAGKFAAFSAFQWRKGVMGLKELNLDKHIVVVGWNEQRTLPLLKLLKTEAKQHLNRDICLCVAEEMENPMPGTIEFVRARSLNDDSDLKRADIEDASTIIVDCAQDDQTLSAALNISNLNQTAHIIAYFRDENLSKLLKQHCPNIECTPSVSTEMMVKSAMDPGSSILHHELLSADTGMTQYSTVMPEKLPEISVRDLYIPMKEHYGATLIAVDLDSDGKPEVNPALDKRVKPGCTLYYIAEKRLKDLDWAGLTQR